jgi:hypothetical protein
MAKVSVAQIKIAKDVLERACPELIKAVREGKKRLGYANGLIGTTKSPVSKEEQKKELEKPPAPRGSKSGQPSTTTPKKTPAANQKIVELDTFKVMWRNFDEMRKQAFVETFKEELAGYLDYIKQQEAFREAAE